MSGGLAYVLDIDGDFARRCNTGLVDLEPLDDDVETAGLRELISRHVELTGSGIAARLLEDWAAASHRFVVVVPRDFKRVRQLEARAAARVA
jgi:glutamate synthase domain-containing protein 3